MTIHDCIHLMFPEYLPNRLALTYARGSLWAAARVSNRILTVSEASKRDILRFFDVPPEKISVIYNGIDERFRVEPAEEEMSRVAQRYQLTGDFVLYAGNVKPHKNVERLIDAFHLVRQDGLDHLKLIVIGDEISKYAELRRAVHRYNLHKYVRFLGYMPDATLAVLYRLAAVFVFPSLYEGFGLPPLEAMASGAPVVTSNVSSMPEVAGDAAVLVDPRDPRAIADGIRRVLTEPGLRETLRAQGSRAGGRVLVGSLGPAHPPDLRRGGRRAVMRVALVHDWLTGMRGGEKVLEALCEQFPSAELFTLVHVPGRGVADHRALAAAHLVRAAASAASGASTASTCRSSHWPIELFDLDGFDLVVSSSHCAAKSVVVTGSRPARVLLPHAHALRLGPVHRTTSDPNDSAALGSRAAAGVMRRLARWDAATAGRVDRYVANSRYVAGRIRRYYSRDALGGVSSCGHGVLQSRRPGTGAILLDCVRAGPLQTDRRRHRGCPPRRATAAHRRRRARPRTPGGSGRGHGRRVSRDPHQRGDPRAVPRRDRRHPAGRGGLRDRGRRGAGLRPAGGVARGRAGRSKRSCPERRACSWTPARPRRSPPGLREAAERPFDAGRIRRHAERFSRERFAREIARGHRRDA